MIYLLKMVIVRYVKLPEGNQSVDPINQCQS